MQVGWPPTEHTGGENKLADMGLAKQSVSSATASLMRTRRLELVAPGQGPWQVAILRHDDCIGVHCISKDGKHGKGYSSSDARCN
jgi:hypothetical protein